LARLTAVPLSVVLNYHVFIAACQAALPIDSRSCEIDIVLLGPFIEEVFFHQVAILVNLDWNLVILYLLPERHGTYSLFD